MSCSGEFDGVRAGDLAGAERMLAAQAPRTLDAIFNEMARRAALNMGQHIEAMDVYMRLALKAQSQARATLETLATIKNPPVVIARQANVTTGPQQVNNGWVQPVRSYAGETDENGNQPHEPSVAAAEAVAYASSTSMLGHQQANGLPVPSSGGEGLERLSVPRRPRRSPNR